MRRVMAVLVALVLVAPACGDDDSSGSADPQLVAGLRGRIAASQDTGGGAPQMTDREIECFAVGIIDLFGADRIAGALDLEFEEFMATASAGERRQVVDVMLECVDLAPMLAAELGGDGSISPEAARCLADVFIASDAFRDATAEGLVGNTDPFQDPELVAALLPSMLECLSPEELAGLGG